MQPLSRASVAIVTGASSGIAAATAEKIVQRGATAYTCVTDLAACCAGSEAAMETITQCLRLELAPRILERLPSALTDQMLVKMFKWGR